MSKVANLAVQMYTLRELTEPLDTILAGVADAGYSGIEAIGNQGVTADELKAFLGKHGLEVSSAHVSIDDAEADLDGVIAFHKAVGNDTLIVPYIAPNERPDDAAAWQALGARLGTLAKASEAEGMQFLYHNHDFEMNELDGKMILEHILDGAGSGLGLELDLAWVVRGNKDPLEMLEKFSGRIKRVHVKDIAPAGENTDEGGWAAVGSGTLDWDTILPAAKEAGAEWYVVEHDEPKDPLGNVTQSAAYLAGKL